MLWILVSALIFLTSLSLWWCWEKADREAAVLSSIRTQNWVTHTTSLSSCFPLCCLRLPQTLAPLLCYSFTSLQPILPSLWRWCLLLFPPLCHCCSVSFTPSPLLCAESICSSLVSLPSPPPPFFLSSLVVSSSISPSSSSPVDSCLSRGNLYIHPSELWAPLCLPSCLSVCAVSGSEWTGGGARRQEWANRQLSSQMLLSVLSVLFLFPLSPFLSASLHHDPPPCVAMQAPVSL